MATVVVKVGTTSITSGGGQLSEAALSRIVDQVVALCDGGHRPVLVSSGAIAAGRAALAAGVPVRAASAGGPAAASGAGSAGVGAPTTRSGVGDPAGGGRAGIRPEVLAEGAGPKGVMHGAAPEGATAAVPPGGAARRARAGSPQGIADLQGLAAVGQGLLMSVYARLFGERGRLVGQVLLTGRDLGERTAYLNARRTLSRLLGWGIVPVVNENDTTATDEISLGENDRLAALVATAIGADLLVILTDTPGVLSADPRLDAEAGLIEEVSSVDVELEAAAGPSSGAGSGGMASKVAAAKIASWSGVPCVIAGASDPDAVGRALRGEPVGTRIRPRARRLSARRVWIAFACPARGRLVVDSGAVLALQHGGRSLLPVGVIEVEGSFEAGEAVEIVDVDRRLVAKGLASSPARLLAAAAGLAAGALPPDLPGEAVHRNDLVVLSDG